MKIDQNIKDTFKASAAVVVVVVLIVVGIMIYDAVTHPITEEIYEFITFSLILHDDLDENEVRENILNLIDNVSSNQIKNPEAIDSALNRQSTLIRRYKERYFILVSPTDEMRALKNNLVEEGNLFLTSYYYSKEALKSRENDDHNMYLSNIEQALQYLDDAMNLRMQNRAELDQWKMEMEEKLSK